MSGSPPERDMAITVDRSETAGDGSVVYDAADVPPSVNDADARTKHVLVSRALIPDAGALFVDVVTYPPGTEINRHYHEGTDHFFYVLDGEGGIEIEGEELPLTEGTVVWVGEGDVHKLHSSDDRELRILEYFSNVDHIMTRLEGEGHRWEQR